MVSYKTANKPGVKLLAFLRLKKVRNKKEKRQIPVPRKHRLIDIKTKK